MELGTLLANMINLIPDGVVIFLPSYSFLDKLKDAWTENGTLRRLDAKKKVGYLDWLHDECLVKLIPNTAVLRAAIECRRRDHVDSVCASYRAGKLPRS